jgi:VanZ family protein
VTICNYKHSNNNNNEQKSVILQSNRHKNTKQMKLLLKVIKGYPFFFLLLVAISVACFVNPPSLAFLGKIPSIDKWIHAFMYLVAEGCLWVEYFRRHKHSPTRRLLFLTWLAPIVVSGIIELLQAYCTGGRRGGEWLDFAANVIGATLANVIGIAVGAARARTYKGSQGAQNCGTVDRLSPLAR